MVQWSEDWMPLALAGLRCTVIAVAAAGATFGCSPEEDRAAAAERAVRDVSGESRGGVGAGAARALLAQAEEAASTGRDTVARDAYEKALAIYEAAGDLSGQGDTLLGMATLARYDGQGEVAREIYARATEVFSQAEDELGQARVEFAVGELERARFNNEDALAAFEHASTVFREHGEWASEGQAMLGIAESERRLGHILAARGAVARASTIFEILRDSAGRDAAEQVWTELRTLQSEHGVQRMQITAELESERTPTALLEAQTHLAAGRLESVAGRPAHARQSFAYAGSRFALIQMHIGALDAWAGLGNLERRLGSMDAASDAYALALAAFAEVQNGQLPEELSARATAEISLAERGALVLVGLGEAENAMGRNGDTRFEEARALVPEGESARVDAALQLGRGRLYRQAGRTDEASGAFAAAERAYAEAGLIRDLGSALLAHADLERERGDTELGLELSVRALDAFLEAQDRLGEGDARLGWADVLSTTGGNTMEARIQYRLAAQIFGDAGLDARAASALERARALE